MMASLFSRISNTHIQLKLRKETRLAIFLHHENMPIEFWPPQTPLLYSKTGVYMGYTFFSYFCSKI